MLHPRQLAVTKFGKLSAAKRHSFLLLEKRLFYDGILLRQNSVSYEGGGQSVWQNFNFRRPFSKITLFTAPKISSWNSKCKSICHALLN